MILVLFGAGLVTAEAQSIKLTLECVPPKKEAAALKKAKSLDPVNDAKSQKPKFEVSPEENVTQPRTETLVDTFTALLGCTNNAYITVEPGQPPNSTIVFNVLQSNPANLVAMRWAGGDPFTTTLLVPVQLNASGGGQSDLFQVKAMTSGTTILQGFNGSITTKPLQVIIIECACPTIVPTLPVRPGP